MIKLKEKLLAATLTTLLVACSVAHAQDETSDRRAAADRYLKAVPVSKMLDDTFAEISKQVPAERRSQFIADMKMVVRAEFVEELTRAAMVKTFTADELNALADFYGSKHGASAMLKFGAYMALVMPVIQAEIQRGIQQLQQQRLQEQPKRPS